MIANQNALNSLFNPPSPPACLRKAGRDFWLATVAEFDLSATDLSTLRLACVQLDRAAAAARDIRRRGVLVEDRFGVLTENPAVAIERAAMNAHRLLVRELALHAAPPDNRPGTMPRGYR